MGIIVNTQTAEKASETAQTKPVSDSSIYCEDCLTGLKKIDNLSVDVCATTPPSFDEYVKSPTIGSGSGDIEDYIAGLVDVFAEVKRTLKEHGTLWVRMYESAGDSGENLAVPQRLVVALITSGWFYHKEITWLSMSAIERANITGEDGAEDQIGAPYKKERVLVFSASSSVKTSELPDSAAVTSLNKHQNFYYLFCAIRGDTMLFCIPECCPDGGTVLDPFMGSGDIAGICVERGFDFIGFEIDRLSSRVASSKIFMENAMKAKVQEAPAEKNEDAEDHTDPSDGLV